MLDSIGDRSGEERGNRGEGLLAMPFEGLVGLLGDSTAPRLFWDDLREGLPPWQDGSGGATSDDTRATLDELGMGPSLAVIDEAVGDDGTRKLKLRAPDGAQTECVLVAKPKSDWSTICVSSQVGCAHSCVFCETGRMGWRRDLTADEILAQVAEGLAVVRRAGMAPIRGVVFTGMGEPSDNILSVRAAVAALADGRRFRFSKRRISVSTVGPSPGTFAELASLDAMIVWSLHAADDEVRQMLVPSATHPVADLRDALAMALAGRKPKMRALMIAVTLVPEVNDAPVDADALAAFLAPLYAVTSKICVDLIPRNRPGEVGDGRECGGDRVVAFQRRLREHDVFSSARVARGASIRGACGLLTGAQE